VGGSALPRELLAEAALGFGNEPAIIIGIDERVYATVSNPDESKGWQ
jgi:hypothetical protein